MAYPYDARNSYELAHAFGNLRNYIKDNAYAYGNQNAFGSNDRARGIGPKHSGGKPALPFIRFNRAYEFDYGEHSGAIAEDARTAGVFGKPELILELIGEFGQTSGDPNERIPFGDLLGSAEAPSTADREKVIRLMEQIQESDQGLMGNPFSRLPPRLAQHMKQHVLGDVTAAYNKVLEDIKGGADLNNAARELGAVFNSALSAMEQRPSGVNLVEGPYGEFVWEGVRQADEIRQDAEYVAFREQTARQRQDLAAQNRARRAGRYQTGLPQDSAYAPIADLYNTQEVGMQTPNYRAGTTEATKPGAAVYTDTPGYIGAHAGQDANTRAKTALERYYEEQGM